MNLLEALAGTGNFPRTSVTALALFSHTSHKAEVRLSRRVETQFSKLKEFRPAAHTKLGQFSPSLSLFGFFFVSVGHRVSGQSSGRATSESPSIAPQASRARWRVERSDDDGLTRSSNPPPQQFSLH